jgi:hypothetical protein
VKAAMRGFLFALICAVPMAAWWILMAAFLP